MRVYVCVKGATADTLAALHLARSKDALYVYRYIYRICIL